ncbi:Transcriptional repressor NrdR [uncultured archaeon]|nr:Transcriptional repressor NrdR [uncultured archaeon]
MKCPFCAHVGSQVIDSRDTSDGRIRRRRVCDGCSRRFTTYEEMELDELYVVKRDGSREPFDKHKLTAGILRACVKRPLSRETVEKIVGSVEQRLRKSPKREMATARIGELVMERLRKVDQVAYIRFASVYESFTDIASFEKALRKLKKGE